MPYIVINLLPESLRSGRSPTFLDTIVELTNDRCTHGLVAKQQSHSTGGAVRRGTWLQKLETTHLPLRQESVWRHDWRVTPPRNLNLDSFVFKNCDSHGDKKKGQQMKRNRR